MNASERICPYFLEFKFFAFPKVHDKARQDSDVKSIRGSAILKGFGKMFALRGINITISYSHYLLFSSAPDDPRFH